MNTRRRVTIGCLVVGWALTGCGGDDDPGSTDELRDAGEVVAERDRTAGDLYELEDTAELGDLQVTISAVEPIAEFDPDEPWQAAFRVTIRSENPTGEDMGNPDVGVSCDGIGLVDRYRRASAVMASGLGSLVGDVAAYRAVPRVVVPEPSSASLMGPPRIAIS